MDDEKRPIDDAQLTSILERDDPFVQYLQELGAKTDEHLAQIMRIAIQSHMMMVEGFKEMVPKDRVADMQEMMLQAMLSYQIMFKAFMQFTPVPTWPEMVKMLDDAVEKYKALQPMYERVAQGKSRVHFVEEVLDSGSKNVLTFDNTRGPDEKLN